MKRLILVLSTAALAVPLGACGFDPTTAVQTASSVTQVCANTTRDEQLRWAAEAAYNVPAAAYKSANTRGLLSADTRAAVKPKLQWLGGKLLQARGAYKACNLVALQQYTDAMTVVKAEVLRLIPNQ